MNKKEQIKAEAVKTLQEWGVTDGTTIYAAVTKVSASGMSRRIKLYFIENGKEGGMMHDLSYHAAKALGWNYKDGYNGGILVSGCGMDMMFHTVTSLSYAMGYGAIYQGGPDTEGLRYKAL